MATLLHRLARACFDRRGLVLVVWLIVLAGVGAAAATLSGPTTRQFDIPGQESTAAIAQLPQLFPGSGAGLATARLVFEAPAGREVTEYASAIRTAVDELGTAPQVAAASDPLDPATPAVSPDRRAAYSSVSYTVPVQDVSDDARAALNRVATEARASGLTVELGGAASVAPFELGITGEVVGVVVAIVVLLITYGALAAAGMNMLTALIGVGTGAAGITALTGFVTLQNTTPILAVMLGLAVGIDYALFIVSRARSELRAGRDVRDAVSVAVGTAGSAVVTAGVTVVIALAGLSIVGIPFLTQMGLAAAATVVIAVVVALTLLPALLGFAGRRILPRRERRVGPEGPTRKAERDSGFLVRWGRGVTGRPVLALVLGVLALGAIASPVLAMRTSLGDDSTASPTSTQRQAYDILTEHFGAGVNGPLLLLVTADAGGAAARGASVAQQVTGLRDVALVLPPSPNADNTAALVTVIPRSGPSDSATTTLVTTIRDIVAPDNNGTTSVAVTGQTAVGVDVSAKLASALPVYLVVVVGLALVLLLVVFRSVLVPLTAALGYLLTIGAALGATTAVFQWGWLKTLVNSDTTAPLLSLAPIIVVGILFGLAMDYQVFLVSRMHEAAEHGALPRDAVVDGFRRAAPVVVAAAVIMFAVFAGFVPQGDATIKPIGFALAVGVLVDALVVRMVLVPAALALLGRAAWWLPSWLRWLPHLDVEGRALETRVNAGEWSPSPSSGQELVTTHPEN
ncbi:MMPL family transporter [Jatrophihabitans sp. YIM 134969]